MRQAIAWFVLSATYLLAYLSFFLMPIWAWCCLWLASLPSALAMALSPSEQFDGRGALRLGSLLASVLHLVMGCVAVTVAFVWSTESPLWLCIGTVVTSLIATYAGLSDIDFMRETRGIPVIVTGLGCLIFAVVISTFLYDDVVGYWQEFLARPFLYNPVEAVREWNEFFERWTGMKSSP